jgi:hypothetical protein
MSAKDMRGKSLVSVTDDSSTAGSWATGDGSVRIDGGSLFALCAAGEGGEEREQPAMMTTAVRVR